MKFTDQMIEAINAKALEKKKAHPYKRGQAGIGTNLRSSIDGTGIYVDNWQICSNLEDISRLIEELTMIKEAVEEEAGVIL